MWLKSDWTSDNKFDPGWEANRAMFGTAFSRLIFGNKYNLNDGEKLSRYTKHLEALKTADIMTKIDTPKTDEKRWYTMLMMYRAKDKIQQKQTWTMAKK